MDPFDVQELLFLLLIVDFSCIGKLMAQPKKKKKSSPPTSST